MSRKEWRSLMLIALCMLMLVVFRSGPVGLRLAVDDAGLSFQLRSTLVQVAFDIGQECSNSNTIGKLIG